MLAAVFYMQPVGALIANIIAIIATSLSHEYIYKDSNPSNCLGDCMEATDKIWRWIVGLGAVIPAITLFARFLIPESPRYLLEVEKDSHTATQNSKKYFPNRVDRSGKSDRISHSAQLTTQPSGDATTHQGMERDEFPSSPENNHRRPATRTGNHVGTQLVEDTDAIAQHPVHFGNNLTPKGPGTGDTTLGTDNTNSNPGSDAGKIDPLIGVHSAVHSTPSLHDSAHVEQYDNREGKYQRLQVQKDNQLTRIDNNLSGTQKFEDSKSISKHSEFFVNHLV